MIYAYPEYYKDFGCIAGECRHSCCIGWEIDIDADTAERYRVFSGELGERMAKCIDWGEVPHFILAEGERCPFLNEKGLCDIILSAGEGALCQICADHPRFRSFFSEREEIGLGLCCEEAARLILSREERFALYEEGGGMYTADEDALMDIREAAFGIIDRRDKSVEERCGELLALCGAGDPGWDWAEFYLGLERLDEKWTGMLGMLRGPETEFAESHRREARNLLNYFVFRHFPAALEDGDLASKGAFAVLSMRIIMALAAVTGESVAQCARMYSSEIEYSDENLWAVWEELIKQGGNRNEI